MTEPALSVLPARQEATGYRSMAYLLFGVAVLHMLLYGLILRAAIDNPYLRGFDYLSTFTAGTIARNEGFSALYDLESQRAVQERVTDHEINNIGGVLPFNHAPLLVPLLRLITTGNYVQSYLYWVATLVLVAAGSAYGLYRVAGRYELDTSVAIAIGINSILLFPVFMSMLIGQDTLFILLGIIWWLYAVLHHRDRLGGVALALTLLKPHITLLLALPLLVTRHRMWWRFCAAATLLGVTLATLVGTKGVLDFAQLLSLSAQSDSYGMNQHAMFNLTGLLIRQTMLSGTTIRLIAWSVFLLTALLLIWLWRRPGKDPLMNTGLSMLIVVFAVPHLHFHDLSLLAITVLAVSVALIERGGRFVAAGLLLPISCSILLMLGELAWRPWRFWIAYPLMLALAVTLICLDRSRTGVTHGNV